MRTTAQAAPGPASQPIVWILSTGGTIAAQGSTPTSLADYGATAIAGQQLVDLVPEVANLATIHVEQIANKASQNLAPADWLRLAHRINALFSADAGISGVVVTHGTNTLEETAYFLNLTVRDERPVVLVGSMRPSTALSSDGPLNLLNAVRTAIAPEARGKGALVVLNDEINAARDVTKTNTYRVETFSAPELGLLGYVDADRISFYRAPTRRHTLRSEFNVSTTASLPRVEVVYSYGGAGAEIITALLTAKIPGIVFAGMGAGLLSPAEREALRVVQSMPPGERPILVRSSRAGNGRVLGLADYDELGMIPADNLNPQKARVLLMLALSRTRNPDTIRRMFAEY